MDQSIKSFEDRLRRVDPDFKPSFWRKFRTAKRPSATIPMRKTAYVIVFTYVALTAGKVVMEQELGLEGYNNRVAEMSQGSDSARIASRLMFRDPVMQYVSAQL